MWPPRLATWRAAASASASFPTHTAVLLSFQSHFELEGLISAVVSSSEHGFMKPHPSIFAAALQLVDAAASDAVMVGDSVRHDVDGALRAGMRAVLLHRGGDRHPQADELSSRGVPVIRSLGELPALVTRANP